MALTKYPFGWKAILSDKEIFIIQESYSYEKSWSLITLANFIEIILSSKFRESLQ